MTVQFGNEIERRAEYPYRGTAVIAFLDLLGFTQRLRQTWGSSSSVLDILLEIKKNAAASYHMHSWYNQVTHGNNNFTLYTYPFNVITVSDSIVIRAIAQEGIFGKSGEIKHRDIYGAFCAIKQLTQFVIDESANLGFGVRGGIEFGEVYMTEMETIGPAFLDAYELEMKAGSARIVIGPRLSRHLQHHPVGRLRENNDIYRCSDDIIALHPQAAPLTKLRDNAPPGVQSKYDEAIAAQARPLGKSLRKAEWLAAAKAGVKLLCEPKNR